jgi:hypothetical protein
LFCGGYIYDIDGQAIEKKLAKKIKAAGKKQLYWSSIIPSKKGEYSYKFFCGITSIRHDSGTFSVSTGPSYEYVGPVGTCMKIKGNTPVSVTNNFSQKSAVFLFGFVRIFSPTDFRIVIKASEKVFKLELPGKTARTNGLIFSSINLPTGEYEYEIFAREKGIFVAIENTGGKFFID